MLTLRLLNPLNIAPTAWSPKPAPHFSGVWKNAGLLDDMVRPVHSQYTNVSAFTTTADGRIFCALTDGRILTLSRDSKSTPFIKLPEKLDAMYWHEAEQMLYATQAASAQIWTITSSDATGLNIKNIPKHIYDIEIGTHGDLYAAQLSEKWSINNLQRLILEHSHDGKILQWNKNFHNEPVNHIATELSGAMSITLSKNADYLLMLEVSNYRVWRIWLTGENTGKKELFVDNLPGFPTGITKAWLPEHTQLPHYRDYFWITMPMSRQQVPAPDKFANNPWLRRFILNFPRKWYPKVRTSPLLALIDDQGEIHLSLQASKQGNLPGFRSLEQQGDRLVLLPPPIDKEHTNKTHGPTQLYELRITTELLNKALAKTTQK